jgi:predicted MFS family arabinose efflux permease
MTSDHLSSRQLLALGFAGAFAMASAMGFGRFSFTPILPGMMADLSLSAGDAGLIAAGNFSGYLAGAVLAAYSWAAGRERLVALSGLFASGVLLIAMAMFNSVDAFTIIRFLAGVASALTMIFTSQIVIGHAARAQKDYVQSMHFGGVGTGIAISSFLVFAIGVIFDAGPSSWRNEWIAGAIFVFASFVLVWKVLPDGPPRSTDIAAEPAITWHPPLVLVMLSYGLFGFGYVVTATFLVTIARMGEAGPMVEFLAWFATGIAAAVSLFVWKPVLHRVGLRWAFVLALAVEGIGVLGSVALPPVAGALTGGVLLGVTFIVITAYGLQLGRQFCPQSPRRAFAFMTAAFGVGQIAGPLVAGWVAEMTGNFTMPTLLAAGALLVCILLVVPLLLNKS